MHNRSHIWKCLEGREAASQQERQTSALLWAPGIFSIINPGKNGPSALLSLRFSLFPSKNQKPLMVYSQCQCQGVKEQKETASPPWRRAVFINQTASFLSPCLRLWANWVAWLNVGDLRRHGLSLTLVVSPFPQHPYPFSFIF